MRKAGIIIGFSLLFASVAPQALAQGAAATPGDPFQGFNRGSFAIHQFLDHWFLRPAAMAYKAVVPDPLRQGVHNLLSNLGEPVIAANDVFQGRFHRAGLTAGRFVANSTIGVAGVFDVATRMGAPHHDNSFGVTLGRAHAGPGPYLFIPLMGPSTVRDLTGSLVDIALDPSHWFRYRYSTEISVGRVVLGGLDKRVAVDPELQALLGNATDPYATLRSAYLQSKQAEIDGEEGGALPALPEFNDQPAAPAPPASAPTTEAAPAAAAPPAAGSASATSPPAPAASAPPPPAAVSPPAQ